MIRSPVLSVALAVLLLAACGGTEPIDAPGSRAPEIDLALRGALSRAMAEHRVAPYSEAWTVLADGAEVAPGAIRLFYTRRIVPASWRASGERQAEPDFWNREHVWPQSAGLKGSSARTDLHNLVPVDRTVNSSRGAKVFDDGETAHHECRLCKVSERAWEPAPEVRGDVARIAFYMDVCYEGRDGMPDLVLDDVVQAEGSRFGRLSTLARWHCEDPVSDEERRRHEAVVRAQGNRNVFIDKPGLAEPAFGFSCAAVTGS